MSITGEELFDNRTYEMSAYKKAHPIKSDELLLFFNMFKLWI
jgi:hypothetical protein